MADRFPSIEDIDAGNGDLLDSNSGGQGNFLDRERAALGEDADLFKTAQDSIPTVTVADGDNDDDDLMGGGSMNNNAEINQFQSSFPAIDSRNNSMAPGGTITDTGSRPFTPQAAYALEDEPEVIKEWRERRATQIEARETAARKRKEETVEAAHASVDEFYENYNNKKDKGIKQTRQEAESFVKNREDTTAGGTSWQRIAKLVDVKPGAKQSSGEPGGKDRFREMLGSLVKDENAPGAKGY